MARIKMLHLLSALSLVIVLCSGSVSVHAESLALRRQTWGGIQVPGYFGYAKYIGEGVGGVIRIRGTIMSVQAGYQFGSISVVYEMIDDMIIVLPSDLNVASFLESNDAGNPVNIYDFPQFGRFSWYSANGKVAAGVFGFKGLSGTLSFIGTGFIGQGRYWPTALGVAPIGVDINGVNEEVWIVASGTGHLGWYVTTK